jgi:hypothetical protein
MLKHPKHLQPDGMFATGGQRKRCDFLLPSLLLIPTGRFLNEGVCPLHMFLSVRPLPHRKEEKGTERNGSRELVQVSLRLSTGRCFPDARGYGQLSPQVG